MPEELQDTHFSLSFYSTICVCVCVCWLSFLCLLPHNHKVVAKTLDIMPSRREKKKKKKKKKQGKGTMVPTLSFFIRKENIFQKLSVDFCLQLIGQKSVVVTCVCKGAGMASILRGGLPS